MTKDLQNILDAQLKILDKLNSALGQEISKIIELKNKLESVRALELEKIENNLYEELKMIQESKKSNYQLASKLKELSSDRTVLSSTSIIKDSESEIELQKMKKREDKLVKQLISANQEIEDLGRAMESKMKDHESLLKNELMNKLQDKEQIMNEELYDSQRRVEALKDQLKSFQTDEQQGQQEVERMKTFFENKITNIRSTLNKKAKKREKEIAQKAIVVYNKKKEKIYRSVIKKSLNIINRPPEIDVFLGSLRESLDLADDVYSLRNFSLCEYCGEPVHSSERKCSNCKMKLT